MLLSKQCAKYRVDSYAPPSHAESGIVDKWACQNSEVKTRGGRLGRMYCEFRGAKMVCAIA